MSDQFNSDKAPEPVGLYPHARKVGDLLFLSGVGPRERGTKEIPGVTLDADGNIIAYNIEKQCRSVFNNVKLILEASGSSWSQLVDVTVFLTNMKDDFKTYNRIYAEYFKDNQPCRTTVEISSLPTPIAIELKCIATIKNEQAKDLVKKEEEPRATDAPPEPALVTMAPVQEPRQPEPEATPTPQPEIERPMTAPVEVPAPEPAIEEPINPPVPSPDTERERGDKEPKPRTPQW
jgi:2-aminomuconate deaminase